MLILSINRSMEFVSCLRVLLAAYLIGVAASAPIGPVNMMAIRRGLISGWRHTLACGLGAVIADLILCSLALLGGQFLSSELSSPVFQTVMAAIGVVVLLPPGIYFLTHAAKKPLNTFERSYRRWKEGPLPAHLFAEVAKGTALTLLNPLTVLYWVGATSTWFPAAYSILGSKAALWGLMMIAAGMITWFTALILFVRFMPRHIDAIFFRLVNAVLGVFLLGLGSFCAFTLMRHFLH